MRLFKRILKIVLIGIILGGLMIMFQRQYGWTDDQLWRNYMFAAIGLVLLSLIISVILQVLYIRKVMATQDLLNDGKIEEFLGENEAILEKTRNPIKRALVKLNMTAGYGEIKDYKKGYELLETINLKDMKGINRGVYLNNKVYFLFKLNRDQEAVDLMEKEQLEFSKWKNSQLAPHILLSRIMAAVYKGDTEQAKEWTKFMAEQPQNPRIRRELELLSEELNIEIADNPV